MHRLGATTRLLVVIGLGAALQTAAPPPAVADSLFDCSIAVGTKPWALAVNVVANKMYVANWSSGSVALINGTSDRVCTTLMSGGNLAPWR